MSDRQSVILTLFKVSWAAFIMVLWYIKFSIFWQFNLAFMLRDSIGQCLSAANVYPVGVSAFDNVDDILNFLLLWMLFSGFRRNMLFLPWLYYILYIFYFLHLETPYVVFFPKFRWGYCCVCVCVLLSFAFNDFAVSTMFLILSLPLSWSRFLIFLWIVLGCFCCMLKYMIRVVRCNIFAGFF